MTIILNQETETLVLIDYDDMFEDMFPILSEEEEEMLRQPARPRPLVTPIFADILTIDDEILF